MRESGITVDGDGVAGVIGCPVASKMPAWEPV
jgi:hypothetical protein